MKEESDSSHAPGIDSEDAEFEALSTVVRVLQRMAPDVRVRVLTAAATFLNITLGRQALGMHSASAAELAPNERAEVARFSDDRTPSPKDFLFDKRPQTDIERVACLAYYLTNYRDTPHFKTLDLSKLNTEAAQLKFANAANAVENANKSGLLVPASKGAKQLSAIGELYVQALPDRDAARAVIAHARPKKKARRGAKATQQRDAIEAAED